MLATENRWKCNSVFVTWGSNSDCIEPFTCSMICVESVHFQAILLAWVYTFFLPCSNIRQPSHPKLSCQFQRVSTFALELDIQHRKLIESVFNNSKKEWSHSSRLVLLDRYDHTTDEDGLDWRLKQTQSLPVSQFTGKPCTQLAGSRTHTNSPKDRPEPGLPPNKSQRNSLSGNRFLGLQSYLLSENSRMYGQRLVTTLHQWF